MLKRLLVAATLVAFAFGALTLAGCAKKQEEAPADSGAGMGEATPPAETGGMDSSSMGGMADSSSMMSHDSTATH